jgi:hypothetical protein
MKLAIPTLVMGLFLPLCVVQSAQTATHRRPMTRPPLQSEKDRLAAINRSDGSSMSVQSPRW